MSNELVKYDDTEMDTAPNPVLFAQLYSQGMRPIDAARVAGYSPGTSPYKLVNNVAVKNTLRAIEDARRGLQEIEGTAFGTVARRMGFIVQNGEDRDAIGAAKVLNDMAGHNAPKEIKLESKSMIATFSDLTSSDLEAILEAANVRIDND